MKRFNTQWATIAADFLVKTPTITVDVAQDSALSDKIDLLTIQIQELKNDLQEQDNKPASNLPTATKPQTIELYYFNEIQDSKLAPEKQINTSSILPVQRTIKASDNLIADTIKALLQ